MGKDMLFYCRGTVEKYIFSKLFEFLLDMYAHRNETEDTLFTERSLKIKQMKPTKVMQYLGINDKFIISKKTGRSLSNLFSSESNNMADAAAATEGMTNSARSAVDDR